LKAVFIKKRSETVHVVYRRFKKLRVWRLSIESPATNTAHAQLLKLRKQQQQQQRRQPWLATAISLSESFHHG